MWHFLEKQRHNNFKLSFCLLIYFVFVKLHFFEVSVMFPESIFYKNKLNFLTDFVYVFFRLKRHLFALSLFKMCVWYLIADIV